MQATAQNKTQDPRQNTSTEVLPRQPVDAVLTVIKVTQSLLNLAERETQALLQNDALHLGIMHSEKEKLSERYAATAKEFRNRLNDFRRIDRGLLDKLEKAQVALAAKMSENRELIKQMYLRAQSNTQSTLFNAQEIGQTGNFFLSSPPVAGNETQTIL